MIDCVKVSSFVFNSATFGASFELLWIRVRFKILYLLKQTIHFCFGNAALLLVFNSAKFGTILYFLCPSRLFFWDVVRFNTFFQDLHMQIINFDFGSTAISFLISIRPDLQPLLHFFGHFRPIANLSPNFSFSWAEMVFNLDFPHPSPTTTYPDKYQNNLIKLNLVNQS